MTLKGKYTSVLIYNFIKIYSGDCRGFSKSPLFPQIQNCCQYFVKMSSQHSSWVQMIHSSLPWQRVGHPKYLIEFTCSNTEFWIEILNKVQIKFPKIFSKSNNWLLCMLIIIKTHLNSSCLCNITPPIFHTYILAEQPTPPKSNTIFTFYLGILFIQNSHIFNI